MKKIIYTFIFLLPFILFSCALFSNESDSGSMKTINLEHESPKSVSSKTTTSNATKNQINNNCPNIKLLPLIYGTVTNTTSSTNPITSEISASFTQSGCEISGYLNILPPLMGSGPFEGFIDNQKIQFIVYGQTNDAGVDIRFFGDYYSDKIIGKYDVPQTYELGNWELVFLKSNPATDTKPNYYQLRPEPKQSIVPTPPSKITIPQHMIISSKEAYNYIGEQKMVCGYVADTRYALSSKNKPTFLNFDYSFPNQTLTVVIWDLYRNGFNAAPDLLYKNKDICVLGGIYDYEGKPNMEVRSQGAITIK